MPHRVFEFLRNGARVPIVIIAGPALLAVAMIAVAVALVQLRADALADTRRDIANLARVFADQTGRSVQAIDLILRDLQDSVAEKQGSTIETFGRVVGSDVVHRELKEKIARLPNVDAFLIVDFHGRLANASRANPNIGLDLSDREYFRHFSTRDDRGLLVSVPTQNRTTGAWTTYFSRRISSPRGDFLGLVIAAVPIQYFAEIFRSVELPRRETFRLARSDGRVLVRYPDPLQRAGQAIPLSSPWHQQVASGGGSYVAPDDFDGLTRMVAVHPLRDVPLVVDAAITEHAALATWRRQALVRGAGSIVIFAYAAYLMLVSRRQFLRLKESGASLQRHNDDLRALSDQLVSSQLHMADLTQEMETILATMDQGLMMVDTDGIVVHCNSQARRLLDLPDELVAARPAFRSVLEYQWNTNRSGREDGSFEVFARKRMVVDRPHTQELKRPDGRVLEVRSIPVVAGGFVRTYTDITQRKTAEEKVYYLAHHDDLTRLVNRVAFRERLQQAMGMARASGRGLAVQYLDLDHFKQINDTRGHDTGDRVLAEAARRMCAAVRTVDTVARLGGDEFAIVLPFLEGEDAAAQLASRLVACLSEPYRVGEESMCIGVSIGIAIFPRDGLAVDTLLQRADAALYDAKRAGRNTFRFFNASSEGLAASA
jgi:diguanylate cyclase (GGDEF)-like protein